MLPAVLSAQSQRGQCIAVRSAFGTKRTSMLTLSMSAFRGKADILISSLMSANDPKPTYDQSGVGTSKG